MAERAQNKESLSKARRSRELEKAKARLAEAEDRLSQMNEVYLRDPYEGYIRNYRFLNGCDPDPDDVPNYVEDEEGD